MTERHEAYTTIPNKPFNLTEMLEQYASDVLLRFVHISDTHLSADPTYTLNEADHTPEMGARELVRQLNALPFKPDFILHTGDVAFDPHASAYGMARDVLSQLKHPIYYLAGNHDDAAMLQTILLGKSEAALPFDYELEINGVQIVCLDSNGPGQFAGGSMRPEQLARLERICKAMDSRPLVIAVHHNALPIGAPFWDTFMRMSNGEAFHRALLPARNRLRGVFFGHVHQNTDTYRDGILYASVVSSWYQLHCWPGQANIQEDRHADPGFNVVTITRAQTFVRRHRFSVPGSGRGG